MVRRHQSAVWGTVYRTLGHSPESEDIVQEVFLRALAALPWFNRRYPFGPWIIRITANCCIDQLRRRKTRRTKLFSDLTEEEEGRVLNTLAAAPEVVLLEDDDKARYLPMAWSLLERLKPRLRMVFVLREIEERSYKEVAEILGIPEVTARGRVLRARAHLHKAFRRRLTALKRGIKNEKTL